MFGLFKKKKNKRFLKKSLADLKDKTRILFIDDRETDLVSALQKEGWRVKYVDDLDSYNNTDLIDSQIICSDIKGVGVKLNVQGEGLGLVKAIKAKYPEKKIILYSSISSHDIFDNAIDLVDKKLFKDGQVHPFDAAMTELSEKLFDWDTVVKDIYFRYRSEFGVELSLTEFNEKMQTTLNGNDIDVEKIVKLTSAGLNVAKSIKILMTPFLG
jgi:hypothetical protein